MKVHYEQRGGIAGIDIESVVDTLSLPDKQVEELKKLIDQTDFFTLNFSNDIVKERNGADYFTYKITVDLEDNQNNHNHDNSQEYAGRRSNEYNSKNNNNNNSITKQKKHTIELSDPLPLTIKPLVKFLRKKALEQQL